MNKSTVIRHKLVARHLAYYVTMPNGLNYTTPTDKTERQEIAWLNSRLCGDNNHALAFIADLYNAEAFFNNVKHNGPDSAPLIVRVIQLALQQDNLP